MTNVAVQILAAYSPPRQTNSEIRHNKLCEEMNNPKM